MAIFRGVGGSGDSSDNSFLQEVTAQANAAEASATSAANSLASIQETEVTSASFDTSDGVLTLTKTGGATVTADLDGRFLTSYTETDPVFSAHVSSGITSTQISNWDTAYGWGNHASAGYLTSETSHDDVLVDGDFSSSGFMKTDGGGNYSIDTATYIGNTESTLVKVLYEANSDTNAFTNADHTKLDGIEANATADQTGAEIKSAYEAVADTNAFTDAEKTKLSGIEASADVTDATNVTSAGAAMLASSPTFTGTITAPNVDISTTGSVTTNIATGADNNNNTDVKVVNIGTGYGGFSGSGDSTTINMGSQDIFAKNIFNIGNGVTTANGSTINLKGTVNVDGNVNVDGKITGSTNGVVLEHNKSADLEPVLELQNTTASGSGYRGAFISMTGYNTSGTEYTRGVIGMGSSTAQYAFPYIAANVTSVSCGIKLSGSTGTSYNALTPCNSIGASLNNGMQCGHPFYKWNTVYATNGNIATSDQTHKRDVEELSEAETRVAVTCKGLLRKYRWKDAYEEKGEEARIHFGIMAQDLRDAFSAEGLDASRYAMFCSDTWWEDETGERHEEQDLAPEGAVETTQLGVRYDELLAFIIAAI